MKQASPHIVLLVDDDVAHLSNLRAALSRADHSFVYDLATNEAELFQNLAQRHPEVVVLDLCLNDQHGPAAGITLVAQILEADPTARILVLTGHDADRYGIQALQNGAASFLEKPVDTAHLLALIKDGCHCSCLRRAAALRPADEPFSFGGLSSRSATMIEALELAKFAASCDQSVMLLGETGTGKGLLADAIHTLHRTRRGNLLRFQPTYATPDLISSELFGHQKGAFTGALSDRKGILEEAHGGSVFIDEVGELPHQIQVLLLDAVQEKRFRRLGANRTIHSDFRLISATNLTRHQIHSGGALRLDFFHRLAQCIIEIPPLRHRMADFEALARSLLLRSGVNNVAGFTDAAISRLKLHLWPGNIRELQGVVEGAAYRAAYANRRLIDHQDLALHPSERFTPALGNSFRDQVNTFEQELIIRALHQCNENQSEAARLLKLDRSTFRRILERSESKKSQHSTPSSDKRRRSSESRQTNFSGF